jgi:hypothetical protein
MQQQSCLPQLLKKKLLGGHLTPKFSRERSDFKAHQKFRAAGATLEWRETQRLISARHAATIVS